MIEMLLATVVLIACLVMLGRMLLPPRQQQRFDAAWRHALDSLRGLRRNAWLRPKARQDAARTAEEAIRKARRASGAAGRDGRDGRHRHDGRDGDRAEADGEWDGNVYRPKSFKPPRKPH